MKILLTVFLITAIFLSGCVEQQNLSYEGEPQETLTEQQEENETWMEKANVENDLSYCENIEDQGLRELCQSANIG